MTLWFVFALMTAAAIFAVLWPLGRSVPAAKRRQRGHRLQGPAHRDRPRRCRRPDRLFRSRGRARRDQPPPAGRGGSSARSAGRVEHPVAPLGRPSSRWLDCRSWRSLSIFRSARRSLAIFRWQNGPARPMPRSRSTIWWRRSRRIWRKIRPTAAAGTCWRRCWRSSAATTMRSGPIAIRSPIMAIVRRAAPISAKPWPVRPAASLPRRPRLNSNARSR